MKTKNLLLLAALFMFPLGCQSTKPPTAPEQLFFTVVTNYIPVVVPTTNVAVLVNEAGIPISTNTVYETNWVEAYGFTPNTNAVALIETGTTIGNFFGVGGIVGTLLGAFFGLWAKIRSNTAFKTAGILAQIIEAGRKVLSTTPQGQKLETEWVTWMSKHQTETGVVLEVAKLLKQVVNKESAQLVADQLIDLAKKVPPKS